MVAAEDLRPAISSLTDLKRGMEFDSREKVLSSTSSCYDLNKSFQAKLKSYSWSDLEFQSDSFILFYTLNSSYSI